MHPLAFFGEKSILTIFYQDDFIVAVNKPAGLFVHRSYMGKDKIYFVLQLFRDKIGQYVYQLHRMDRATSGGLLFGLNENVAHLMAQAFIDKNDKNLLRSNTWTFAWR